MRLRQTVLVAAALVILAGGWVLAGGEPADLLALASALPFALPLVGISVPSEQAIADKFVRVTQGRQADYSAGIAATNPAEFENAAAAAAATYADGVQQAIAENRFATGVQGSGARWRRKSEQVGAQRFSTGVAASKEDMAAGMAPYVQTLRGLTLEPRRPRGDPANMGRVAAVAQALNQRRRQGGR